ncbi:SDR family oxidoreductase [Thermosynechococcaceae cyanobacterium BACA0444]|uniref:SDR family oxidoreductase n=1 Tax=Pseudocalidococcus azoricus BACA0444 TaxID=2918990 RepID=A0AAE4FSR0_9CYAN|nr:SDR family oxidoreductase [Pseudocalidococcus azoricus]MDS3860887.1 SDR family oxidoreductase [Pseudocalidococcus azoricus BACA0444]
MVLLAGQTVLITGASSGIGQASAVVFAEAGCRLILLARRLSRLEELAASLKIQYQTECLCLAADVQKQDEIIPTLKSLPQDWQTIDILINNAGLSRGLERFDQASLSDWEEMIDTNIKGLLYVTHTLLPGMLARGQGQIINIGSIAGLQVYPGGHVYCGTKAAVQAITEGLKQDLLGTPIRVSCIDPGLVETEFSQVRFHGDTERAEKVYQGLEPLTGMDVAEVILFCATRPAHVNLNQIILMPTAQASTTRVHREANLD